MSNISYFGDNIPNKLSEKEFEYYYRLYKNGDIIGIDIGWNDWLNKSNRYF